jgi:amino acid transporter
MHGRPPAGPSIAISFFLVAIACSFAGLCYAELASMIPIAGSAYTYSYATLGEIFAWIIGWDLILEYVVSNVAVAVGFAGYTKAQLAVFGLNLPEKWASPVWAGGEWTGAYFNLPGLPTGFHSRLPASPESSPGAPSFSLPISDSIPFPPPPKNAAIRKKICPSASSCRWLCARCSTSALPSCCSA